MTYVFKALFNFFNKTYCTSNKAKSAPCTYLKHRHFDTDIYMSVNTDKSNVTVIGKPPFFLWVRNNEKPVGYRWGPVGGDASSALAARRGAGIAGVHERLPPQIVRAPLACGRRERTRLFLLLLFGFAFFAHLRTYIKFEGNSGVKIALFSGLLDINSSLLRSVDI